MPVHPDGTAELPETWQGLHDAIVGVMPEKFRTNSYGALDMVMRLVADWDRMLAQPKKRFPIMIELTGKGATPHPTSIAWSIAEKAYAVYAARHGKSQSLDRLADRGGFYASEMDDLYPAWRQESEELAEAWAELAKARDRVQVLEKQIEAYRSTAANAKEAFENARFAFQKLEDAQLLLGD